MSVNFHLYRKLQAGGQILSGNAIDAAIDLITVIIGKVPYFIDPLRSVRHYGDYPAKRTKALMPGIAPDLLIINVSDHDLHQLAGVVAETDRRTGDVGF